MAVDISKDSKELKYYYSDNGVTKGPLPLSQLLECIDSETLVYREGIDWTIAGDVAELKNYFNSQPLNISAEAHSRQNYFANLPPKESGKMFAAPFSFNGRIRILEYGISFIIYYVVYMIGFYLMNQVSLIFGILMLPIVWFLIAQGAKRCCDRGNSGWYQIIPFYVFWMLFAEGDKSVNEYGNSPK